MTSTDEGEGPVTDAEGSTAARHGTEPATAAGSDRKAAKARRKTGEKAAKADRKTAKADRKTSKREAARAAKLAEQHVAAAKKAAKAVTKASKARKAAESPKGPKPAKAAKHAKPPKATKPAKPAKPAMLARVAAIEPAATSAALPLEPAAVALGTRAGKPPKPSRSKDGRDQARKLMGRAGSAGAAAAGTVLREVAGLVRQATEPAASRIVGRVGRHPGGDEAAEHVEGAPAPRTIPPMLEPEPMPEPAAPEPEPEPAAIEPEPMPEPAAPEPEPAADDEAEPEPEPVEPEPAAPEPEPEPDAAEPEPEPELEPAAPEPDPGPAEPAAPEPEPERAESEPTPVVVEPPSVTPGRETLILRDVPPDAVVGASIDVGSNSVHLLVGIVDGHHVDPVVDESVFLGLGDKVSTDGFLGDELRAALVADLARYVDIARSLGATAVTIVGTEPIRRADDSAATVHEVMAGVGFPLHVLDHDEEGLLMLLGVTGGRPVEDEILVVDIGGGSSELVSVTASGEIHATGLQIGSARLTRSLVHTDPPSLADLEAMRLEAARVIGTAPPGLPQDIIAVGGTASNLLKLLPATAVDRALTRRRIAVALAMLTVERSREAAARHLIRPERAKVLPAGAIIVDALLEHYQADRLRVSEEGIREGAILAAAIAGPSWRDRLRTLAAGWDAPPSGC